MPAAAGGSDTSSSSSSSGSSSDELRPAAQTPIGKRRKGDGQPSKNGQGGSQPTSPGGHRRGASPGAKHAGVCSRSVSPRPPEKTEIYCPFLAKGSCRYDTGCHYSHNKDLDGSVPKHKHGHAGGGKSKKHPAPALEGGSDPTACPLSTSYPSDHITSSRTRGSLSHKTQKIE